MNDKYRQIPLLILFGTLLGYFTFRSEFKDNADPIKMLNSSVQVETGLSIGSGTVVKSDNVSSLILTVKHVCLDAKSEKHPNNMSPFFPVLVSIGPKSKTKHLGYIIEVSQTDDLCLIETLFLKNSIVAPIGNNLPEYGKLLHTVGNPAGRSNVYVTGRMGTGHAFFGNVLNNLASISISSGQSGSALYNNEGEIIGVLSIASSKRLDFAEFVPVHRIKRFLQGKL